MPSRCDFGLHQWNGGCKCGICGARRDGHHSWNGCTCATCGARRKEEHDWDGCICRICGTIQPPYGGGHDWDGCICRKCGHVLTAISDGHDWNGCTCRKCGTIRSKGHEADENCVCAICGGEAHDWEHIEEEYADTEQFEACGGGLENMWMLHQPGRSFLKCRRCGKESG